MSDLESQRRSRLSGCATCAEQTPALVVRALAHGDENAWVDLRDHFADDVRVLVASSPPDCRKDVQSAVTGKLFETLARPDIYTWRNVHGYVRRAMANAKVDVLRKRTERLLHELPLAPSWDAEDGREVDCPASASENADAVERCLKALSEAKDRLKERPLAHMSLQVIEVIFLADLDGENIDRVEACRRLGLSHELKNISPKLSKMRRTPDSPLHDVINSIDPGLFSLLGDRISKEQA